MDEDNDESKTATMKNEQVFEWTDLITKWISECYLTTRTILSRAILRICKTSHAKTVKA